ncbi:MAG: SDR family NAD(P)-dependent oxidoreductase [Actinomycetota bacterium]
MDLTGKTAVITGGASGMGRAFADRFGAAGCKVVVADIEEPAIETAIAELESAGVEAMGVRTDVADGDSMDALGDAVTERFGATHVVCLNAGVGAGGPMGEVTAADWEWVLGVNLWGVIHGIRVFLPALEAQDQGHIVITASVAGILSYPQMGPYNASKHAVLSMAETMHHELQAKGSAVGVTALCPGLVNTNILDSERNRPESLSPPALEERPQRRTDEEIAFVRELYSMSLQPAKVAEMVHDAVVERRFYVLTDSVFDEAIEQRHREIEGRSENPSLRGHLLEEQMRSQRDPG